jgi:hypothetical protein
MMLFIFAVYYMLIKRKLDERIDTSDKEAYFKFGSSLKTFGEQLWKLPGQIIKKIPIGKK